MIDLSEENLQRVLKESVANVLNEAEERTFVSSEKLFDVLAEMKGNLRMCIGYITVAKLNIPTVKRKNPETNRMKSYPDYETFTKEIGAEREVAAIVKVTKYHKFNFTTPSDLSQRHKEYRDAKDQIKLKYGLNPTNRDAKQGKFKQIQDYGTNGIAVYNGDNEEKTTNSYLAQNTYGAEMRSIYYLLDADGSVIKSLGKNDLLQYLKANEIEGVSALRKLGADENTIKQYIDDMGGLKFRYQNFESKKILYIAAKAQADEFGKFTYINQQLPDVIDGVKIDSQYFVNLAMRQYKIDINEL